MKYRPITYTSIIVLLLNAIGMYERQGHQNFGLMLKGMVLTIAATLLFYGYQSNYMRSLIVKWLGIICLGCVAFGIITVEGDFKSFCAGASLGIFIGHIATYFMYRPVSYKYAAIAAHIDGYERLARYFEQRAKTTETNT